MAEMKTAEEIVDSLTAQDNGFIYIAPATLKLLLEKHLLQFRPTDEEIREICTDGKGNVSMVEIEAMMKLREQIFKTHLNSK